MLATDIIFLDGEFTRLKGELLELAIVDFNGETLYYQRFRPKIATRWKKTEHIHHITPDMVKDCPFVEQEREKIQEIIDKARYVVSLNVDSDKKVLANEGINLPHTFDLRILEILLFGCEKLRSLKDLAKVCGYDVSLANWHCSQDDAFVTSCLFLDLYRAYSFFGGSPLDPLKAIRFMKEKYYKEEKLRKQIIKSKSKKKNGSKRTVLRGRTDIPHE